MTKEVYMDNQSTEMDVIIVTRFFFAHYHLELILKNVISGSYQEISRGSEHNLSSLVLFLVAILVQQ
jgi:hypothetical protein